MAEEEKKRFISSLFIPGILLLLMWIIKIAEVLFGLSAVPLGIYPLHMKGLPGIIFSPFIHSGFKHLATNSVAFLFLGTSLFYFYREIALKTFVYIWILTGVWVWFGGRESYHIGASGIIYGLAAFLFFSGIIRKNPRLSALTLIVTFLYGSLIWGAIPGFLPDKQISWEAHLGGLVSGVILSVLFRHSGPQRKKYSWEFEEDDDDDEVFPYWSNSTAGEKDNIKLNQSEG